MFEAWPATQSPSPVLTAASTRSPDVTYACMRGCVPIQLYHKEAAGQVRAPSGRPLPYNPKWRPINPKRQACGGVVLLYFFYIIFIPLAFPGLGS